MSKEILVNRYKKWFNQEPSPLVYSQINKLLQQGYTYLDISNAIWYTFLKLKIPNNFEMYGIHYVTQKIEESVLYFNDLERRRILTSQQSKERKGHTIIDILRPKRKIRRKEYNWDDIE